MPLQSQMETKRFRAAVEHIFLNMYVDCRKLLRNGKWETNPPDSRARETEIERGRDGESGERDSLETPISRKKEDEK